MSDYAGPAAVAVVIAAGAGAVLDVAFQNWRSRRRRRVFTNVPDTTTPPPSDHEERMPAGLIRHESINLSMMFDTSGRVHEAALVGADGPREMSIRFSRWPRLRWLYWLERLWLPRWCYTFCTFEARLTKYKVVAADDDTKMVQCTFKPEGEARWGR